MIDIGVDQDVCQQARARVALRQWRRLGAGGHDGRLTGLLRRVLEAHVLDDGKPGRLVMQRLAALLADALERIEGGLLFGAQVVFNARAWQVLRQSRTTLSGVTLNRNLGGFGWNR